jgi:hypothetical protein
VTSLPVLNLYTQKRSGQFISDQGYAIVGWPGRTLHRWHTETDIATPELEPDQNVKARFDYDAAAKKWYFVNLELRDIVVLDSVLGPIAVPPGQKVELKPEMRILFGPPPQYRMAYVQMLKTV